MAKMTRVLVPFPEELLAAIDEQLGLVPRAAWLRQAAEEKLARESDTTPEADSERSTTP